VSVASLFWIHNQINRKDIGTYVNPECSLNAHVPSLSTFIFSGQALTVQQSPRIGHFVVMPDNQKIIKEKKDLGDCPVINSIHLDPQ
jgi:hypothetical protein